MKTAIVLFNLGGPDGPEAVKRFRINLFMDKAIIRAPIFVRFFLARYIAGRTQKAAEENYALLGGKSPLLETTKKQAAALQDALGDETKVFVTMRYWHPFASAIVEQVKQYDPDRVLLLPLYPQFSTTTTGSSFSDWHEQAAKAGLVKETVSLCCYFADEAYVKAVADLLAQDVAEAKEKLQGAKLRLLFSAHGLPESIIKHGDPYQFQVEQSVAAVMRELPNQDVEHVVCYQSRATPQVWISPSTIDEIERAGRDGVAVLVVPIAFVSDHIETLVELDVENREIAHKAGVTHYFRARVPNEDAGFIAAMAKLAERALAHGPGLCSYEGKRVCPMAHSDCPRKEGFFL